MALPSGMVTFMFTDIEGSSGKWDKAHDEMADAIGRHDAILDRAIAAHGGSVVKKIGDGYMAAFTDPVGAVTAAVESQRSLADTIWEESVGPIRVRVGIHTGPGEPKDDDYLGPSVNRAARLEAAGHGGQILVSAATRELIGDRLGDIEFLDLGEHQLRGLTRSERILQVHSEGLSDGFPPLSTESTPTNLPAQTGELIGRHRELDALAQAMEGSRLLTMIGAGGVGKTTLALRAAQHVMDRHSGGVWLLELAPLSDARLIPAELLGAMRRPAAANRNPEEILLEVLEPLQALLVLDNCEHLIDDIAALATAILRRAPQVSILATSREPLGVHDEQVWTIPTMGLPQSDDLDGVLASDAGALFAARARQADQSIVIDDTTAPVVAALCRRLDGLPLAIELAAARLRSISIQELDRRLEDRFKLLHSRDRNVVPHHQTLRATVAWSYDLLEPDQQRLYRLLSIFVGGFDLEAAEAVEGETMDVLDGLDQLVSQSLIEADRTATTRFRMLETIREFGVERLRGEGEYDDIANAHLNWVGALAREGARGIEGRDQVIWLKRFRTEIDNIRAALAWARQHDPVTGGKIASALSRFFWMYAAEGDSATMSDSTSFLQEGYDWSTAMLEAGGDDLPEVQRARLQLGIGGLLCIRLGRFEEARDRLTEARDIFERLGDERSVGWATFYDALARFGAVELEETIQQMEKALRLHQAAEDRVGTAISTLLAGTFRSLSLPGSGRPYLEKFAAGANAIGSPLAVAHAVDALAFDDALSDGVTVESKRNAAQSLAMFRRINNYACLCHALGSAAAVLTRLGDFEGAARALGLTDAVRDRLNMAIAPYEDNEPYVLDMAGEAADEPEWERAVAEGRTFEPDEGIDWVISRLGHDAADLETN